ncbi:MAG: GNAT family N-acetyltransferase [Alphaproteobacteria bacterium]
MDDGLGQSLTPFGRACFNLAASVGDVKLHGLCAGIRSKDDLWRTMRKSFRSLVNWGRRETDLVRVNGSNPDRGLFDRYRAFHHQIAGRITRSDKFRDVMFDWIAAGHGELVLTYLADGALVAGTMIVDGKEIAYYASGVYDRTRFDRPMGHWPLFSAIMQSMERGIKAFDLGELPQRHQADPKEYAIGYFKRGFAQEIAPHFVWSWSPTRKSSHDAP